MADSEELPISRWKPKPPSRKFSWLGDPADKTRKNKAQITNGQSAEMLAYNQRLASPGGGGLVQWEGGGYAPPSPLNIPSSRGGWETPNADDRARIENHYTTPGSVSVRPMKPVVGTDRTVTPGAPPPTNPAVVSTPRPDTGNPNYSAPVAGAAQSDVSGAMAFPGSVVPRTSQPEGVGVLGQEPTVPGLPGAEAAVGVPAPAGDGTNPHTGGKTAAELEKQKQDNWIARGGSLATYHRQQVAEGLRPRIDARATSSPRNSTASTDVANQMTGDFNTRNAAPQARWKQKFEDARTKLREQLEP